MEPGWRPALILALVAAATACAPPGGGTASQPRTAGPSQAELTAVAEQVIPRHPQFDFYVECINFKENGVSSPDTGNDYSACPLTPELRASMAETQAHFCPCDQNVSRDRTIKVGPAPDGGGVVTILLYLERVKVELHVIRSGGRWVVDQVAGKGDLELGPVAFHTPTPTPAPPTARPPETLPPTPTPPPSGRVLAVPWYHQVYNLSCEEAALRMALAYAGIATTDDAVYRIVGNDPRPPTFDAAGMHWGNPYTTFVGNINGSEVALTGYGTYYPTIARAAGTLGGHVLRSGEGIPPGVVYQAILDGHPVVAWVTYHWVGAARRDYTAFDGQTIPYAGPVEHAVTVVGVSATQVLINNPSTGPEWIDRGTFEAAYAIYNRMAVILS